MMNSVFLILLLLQSFATPPRATLENPAAVTAIPKNLQKDYDKLWTRFLTAKSAKDDSKVASDTASLLKKNKDFPPLLLIQSYLSFYAGKPADAEKQFNLVLAKDPANRIALYYLAEMSYARNDFGSAGDLYTRLLAVDHSHPEVEPKLQKALLLAADNFLRDAASAEEAGRLADAESIYRRALQRSPMEPVLHALLGGILAKEKKWDAALVEFQRQIELAGPSDASGALAEAQRHVIEALTNLGRAEEARVLSERLLASGTPDAELARNARELDDLGRWGPDIARFRAIESAATITREQFAVLMVRYFPQILELPRTTQIVTDIQESWASSEIQTVVALGILDPLANHTFQPARIVTRGEFAMAISRLSHVVGAKPSSAPPIPTTDLASSSALYQDVQLVLGYGMLSLDSAGNFGINGPVTGKEAVSSEVQLMGFSKSFQQTRP